MAAPFPILSVFAALPGLILAASVATSAVAAPVPAASTKSTTVAARAARGPAKSTKAAKSTAPKAPVAAKNIAVGAAAVPALPKALMADGCLDATHGEWLSGELAAAGEQWRARGGGFLPVELSGFAAAPAAGNAGDDGGAAMPAALSSGCLPFASVRTPANRIESLALLPASANGDAGALKRAMVVSRSTDASAPDAEWIELAATPPGYREVWLTAAGLLAGDAADKADKDDKAEKAQKAEVAEPRSERGERGEAADVIPQRWQRDVTLLVRQMKKQALAPDTVWVRLVLQGDGEAARVSAVELVDESTGAAIDSALWIDRDDGPGGFVSARGGDHERLLWQSPVDYRRISRGVGAASVIVRRRVLAKPKTPDGKPRMVVRSFRTHGQHQGVDYAAPKGTPVAVVADGTVVHAGRSGGYGNLVVVDHGGGITTYYAHLSAFGVQEGMRVERGQEIGQVGSTGMSTGPHLHYEIRKDGKYLDPADPAQTLPNWSLAAGEHRAALAHLLALSLSREQAFARATRSPSMASASASAPQGTEAE